MIRNRTRALTPSQQRQHQQLHPGAQQGRPSLLKRGQQADAARVAEGERQFQVQNNRREPNRLWVPFKGSEADRTKEFIILDSNLGDCPVFYEHALLDPNTGKRTLHEMCIKELEHCPLCEKFGDSYYIQMISIIELLGTPFVMRDGTELWHMKKLLPVKYQQQEAYWNLCNDTFGGNIRGAHIITTRDASQRSPAIGMPRVSIDPQTKSVVQYSEQELEQSFGHEAVFNQQGQQIKAANEDLYPFNYEEIFPTPTAEELRRQYGGIAPAGSPAETQQVWGNNGSGDVVRARDIRRHMQQTSLDESHSDDELDDEIPF